MFKKYLPLTISALLIVLMTFAVYSAVLRADFVMWDDDIAILNNHGLTNTNIWWVFSYVDNTERYNPFIYITWYLLYQFAGFDPQWFLFANLLFHALSALCLYLSLREVLRILAHQGWIANPNQIQLEFSSVSGALIWALHPLRVEVVSWATCAVYCQAMFFLMAALLCYLKAHQAESPRAFRIFLWLSLGSYACSLFTFPIGITFFLVFLVIDSLLLQRVRFDTKSRWQELKPVVLEKALFAVPAVSIALATVILRHRPHRLWAPPVSLADFGIIDRVMQACYIWIYYLWKPFYPVRLAPVYTTLVSFDPFAPPFVLSLLAVLAISAVCVLMRKRWPQLLALWLCYLLLQMPFLGIFEHPYFTVDRYSLLSSLCFSVLATALLAGITRPARFKAAAIATLLLITLLGALSFRQSKVWRNTETLLTHMIDTLGNDPYRIQIMGRLATYYNSTGETEKSIATLLNILSLKPTSHKAHSQLAAIYCAGGRYAEALPHYFAMLAEAPDNPRTHYDLGMALIHLTRNNEAEQHFQTAEKLWNRPVDSSGKSTVPPAGRGTRNE